MRNTSGRLRLGLCCQFVAQPIKFRTTTASALLRMSLDERRERVAGLCLANAEALLAALDYCARNQIGCFRVISDILPVKTHPAAGYRIGELPGADAIVTAFRRCGAHAQRHKLRVVFHPGQFVVLNSPRDDVVTSSISELEYHAEVAEWISADVINIHAGGAYGDKASALATFERNLDRLSDAVRRRLTIENDDVRFTPSDLLPLCKSAVLPLVYDVHHHRCLRDGLTVEQATDAARQTWNREPLFHLSSPVAGWTGPLPQRHHDYIDPHDFPSFWQKLPITVEIEAKAKELAVAKLRDDLQKLRAASARLAGKQRLQQAADNQKPCTTRKQTL